MNINNKCREVLGNILTNFPGGLGQYPEIYKQVKEALNEPLRNCDVGNEKEQTIRYEKFCNKYQKMKGMCKDCPVYLYIDNTTAYDCYAHWSQMPYKKGKIND